LVNLVSVNFKCNSFEFFVLFYSQLYIQIQGSPQPKNNNKKFDFIAYGTNQYNYVQNSIKTGKFYKRQHM